MVRPSRSSQSGNAGAMTQYEAIQENLESHSGSCEPRYSQVRSPDSRLAIDGRAGVLRSGKASVKRPTALVIDPHLERDGGPGTPLDLLFRSRLAEEFELFRFHPFRHEPAGAGLAAVVGAAVNSVALAASILMRGASIVHLNSALSARVCLRDVAYLVMAKLCGTRVVYQIDGGALPQQVLRGRRMLRSFMRGALYFADVIVVSTQMELRGYRKYLGARHVAVIPPCIDRAAQAGSARARRAPETPLRLLYLGEFARKNGLLEMLQGLRLACCNGVAANLVMAGNGPDEQVVIQFVRAFGLAGQVTFIGPVSGRRKIRLLQESDVIVLATHGEAMPYALLEAMASGVAVVATRVGGIPDVMVDGVHGLFVPPYNPLAIARAIQRLAHDRGLLERMTEACRRRVAGSFSAERLSGDFVRLYRDVCGSRPAKALYRS